MMRNPASAATNSSILEMRFVTDLLSAHVAAYYAASNVKRERVYRLIDEAWTKEADVHNKALPGGHWRHSWPEAARSALLALWATPRK
jgi:hypothetical protein